MNCPHCGRSIIIQDLQVGQIDCGGQICLVARCAHCRHGVEAFVHPRWESFPAPHLQAYRLGGEMAELLMRPERDRAAMEQNVAAARKAGVNIADAAELMKAQIPIPRGTREQILERLKGKL